MTKETTGTTDQDENARLEAALENDAPAHSGDQTETGDATEATNSEPDPEAEADTASDAETDADPKPETVKPTPPRKLSGAALTRHEEKVARDLRLQEAQAEMPPETPVTDAELEALEAKADLQDDLAEIADAIQQHENAIEKLKKTARDCMGKLYPASVKSDRHVDAVRGYLKASQEERRTRGAHPARLKELLAKAGKAPIDAAFQRARARGQGRPTRSPVGQGKAPAEDQANKATPGQE